MTEIDTLLKRIDAEFSAVQDNIKKSQLENMQEYRERQNRLAAFAKLLEELRELWKPRLEALRLRFGEKVNVTPRITPSSREATFEFHSALAQIRLRFSVFADSDVRNVQLTSDLEIVPILIHFDAHSEIEFPLEATNKQAVASWIDDRIVSFVRTYLAIHKDNLYLKDHLVEDPITQIKFPKYAAGATLDWKGSTYYFVDQDSRKEFAKQKNIVV